MKIRCFDSLKEVTSSRQEILIPREFFRETQFHTQDTVWVKLDDNHLFITSTKPAEEGHWLKRPIFRQATTYSVPLLKMQREVLRWKRPVNLEMTWLPETQQMEIKLI
jgi:hypothetical protein